MSDQHKTKTQLNDELEQIRSRTDELERKRADEAMHNLIEIIHFAEHVSTKIHGLLDETELYRTVKEAFAQSKSYTASILLLTDDDSSLRIAEASLSPEKVKEGEKATGLRIKGYRIDLKKSSIYRQVVREEKTVQAKVSDIIGELFPRPLAYLISKTTGYEKKSSILTPLKRHGKIIGAFAVTSPELNEHFIPSVINLARHISNAMEWADENRERERAEKALHENEDKYRTIFENISDQIIYCNKYGTIISANDHEATFGRKPEEIIGKNFTKLGYFNVKDTPKYLKLFKDVIAGKKTINMMELEVMHKDGHKIPVEVSTKIVKKDGKIEGILCIAKDITESKQAKEVLQKSEDRYRTVIEDMPALICRFRPDGTLTFVNSTYCQYFGKTYAELVGHNFFQFIPVEDRERVREHYDSISKEKPAITYEHQVIAPDGTIRWQRWTDRGLFDESGALVEYQSIGEDITEQKRAEEEIQRRTEDLTLINDLNNAIDQDKSLKEIIHLLSRKTKRLFSAYGAAVYLISEDKKILAVVQIPLNQKTMQRIEKVSGFEIPRLRIPLNADGLHREVVQEKKMLLINDQKRVLRWMTELANYSSPLGKPYPKSVQMLIPQISKMLGIRSTMVAPLISEGEIIGLLEISGQRPFIESDLRRLEILSGQISTVIKRKQAEEDLKTTQEKLRNLSTHLQSVIEEERTNIAREIHDELAQALTALQIDLFWLGERIPAGKEDLIQKINSMSHIVETVIQSTQRISTELRPVLLDTLGLSAAIEWQVEEFQKRTGIQCEVVIDSAEIDLDPDRSTAIYRILQESLTNVARHADANEVWVRLNRHSDKLILEVVDNGKGITQDQISGSMAFGLIGMRERIRPWGGEFNICGIDGKGTTVAATISLDN